MMLLVDRAILILRLLFGLLVDRRAIILITGPLVVLVVLALTARHCIPVAPVVTAQFGQHILSRAVLVAVRRLAPLRMVTTAVLARRVIL